MFRSILVPLDGSRFAEAALPLAARLARAAKASLQLLLVHEPTAALVSAGDMPIANVGLDAELQQNEASYLAGTAAAWSGAAGRVVGCREVDGTGGPDICEEAARLDTDLVVMGTHGRGTFRRLWLGSVADYVVRHLSVPILLVHPDRLEEPRGQHPLGGILVALDLSKDATAILEPVTALAQLTQSHVTLLHALDSSLFGYLGEDPRLLESFRVEAQRELDRTADRLRERGLSASTRVTLGGSSRTLLATLEEERFDLIALTTHGAGGMRRLLLGSVADKVIRGAAKPVLVVRPPVAG